MSISLSLSWTITLQHKWSFLCSLRALYSEKLWMEKQHPHTQTNSKHTCINKIRTCVNSQNRIGKTYIKHPQPHHLSTRGKLLPPTSHCPTFQIAFIPILPFYITQQSHRAQSTYIGVDPQKTISNQNLFTVNVFQFFFSPHKLPLYTLSSHRLSLTSSISQNVIFKRNWFEMENWYN